MTTATSRGASSRSRDGLSNDVSFVTTTTLAPPGDLGVAPEKAGDQDGQQDQEDRLHRDQGGHVRTSSRSRQPDSCVQVALSMNSVSPQLTKRVEGSTQVTMRHT